MYLKNFLKTLNLKYSDLLILGFLLFGFMIFIQSNQLFESNSYDLFLPSWSYFLFFGLLSVCYLLFFLIEIKNQKHILYYYFALYTLLLVTIALATFLNKDPIIMNLVIQDETTSVSVSCNIVTKFIHYFSFVFISEIIFLGFYILPKRLNNHSFIKIICYTYQLFVVFLIIYSLFADKYIDFFTILFGNMEEFPYLLVLAPKSIFPNANNFAFFLEFSIFISMVTYAIYRKKIHIVFGLISCVFLLFTICKTGIIITLGLSFALLIYLVIDSFFKKKKKYLILYGSILLSIVTIIIVLTLVIVLNPSLKEKVSIIFSNSSTFSFRLEIWNICLQIISKHLLIGMGYGTFNSFLLGSAGFSWAHNCFLSALGKGGIIYLSVVILVLVITVLKIKNIYKYNHALSVALLFGFLLFVLHSLLEDILLFILAICIITAILEQFYKDASNQNE